MAQHSVGVNSQVDSQAEAQPREIRARSFTYAVRAIKLYQYLQKQKDGAGWTLGKQ